MDRYTLSQRNGYMAIAPTDCSGFVKFKFQVLLVSVLFFLATFTDGFVANRCCHNDSRVRLQIPLFQSSSSLPSIDSDSNQSSLDVEDATEHDVKDLKKTTLDSSKTTQDSTISDPKRKIPVHLLAGFLGSGKTTTLRHILENKEDVKVGVIVNDVASVNIDAKLISRRDTKKKEGESDSVDVATIAEGEGEVVELQNGCACCSLAGELFDSIETLLQPKLESGNDGGIADYDAILVELSGVADPVAIKNNWKSAIQTQSNTLVTEASQLGNVVTLVDATTFGSDYMTFDILKDRDGWFENDADSNSDGNQKKPHSLNRQVVELLAEQVEAADLIVVNKEDLAGDEKTEITKTMAQSLNEEARVVVTRHGNISAKELLELDASRVLHQEGKYDDINNYSAYSHSNDDSHDDEPSGSHSHSHDHAICNDSKCTDPSHDHSHSHDLAKCEDVECEEHSHDHSHSHDHHAFDDPKCTDPSHDHSHSHDHRACNDPNCTDPSHDHSHSHDHDQPMTSTANIGISSFVYKATRPFQPQRLQKLIFDWPIPIKEELDFDLCNDALKTGYGIDAVVDEAEKKTSTIVSPFVGVLRSKGFCWIAPTAWEGILADPWRHDAAMYWSHAGKHFGIQPGGSFWASLPRSSLEDFFEATPDPEASIRKVLEEDFVTEEFGDRRQELVFIGVSLRQQDIEAALDDCLLTDAEMEEYREKLALSKGSSL